MMEDIRFRCLELAAKFYPGNESKAMEAAERFVRFCGPHMTFTPQRQVIPAEPLEHKVPNYKAQSFNGG